MTNEQALELWNNMVDYFGDRVPHPIHQPIQFNYYLKLFFYYKQNKGS